MNLGLSSLLPRCVEATRGRQLIYADAVLPPSPSIRRTLWTKLARLVFTLGREMLTLRTLIRVTYFCPGLVLLSPVAWPA